MGNFHFVIRALETPEAAWQRNRDRQAKAALQKGLINPVYPRASHWHDSEYQYGPDPKSRLEAVVDETRYGAAVHAYLPTDEQVEDSWEYNGIFYLNTHGHAGCASIADAGGIYGENGVDPERDVVLDEMHGLYPHVYFVQFQSCQSALDSAEWGNLCEEMRAAGADITLGFKGKPRGGTPGHPEATWEQYFYHYAIGEQYSVWNAAKEALEAVKAQWMGYPMGYDTFLIGPISRRDQSLAPARYGVP